MLAIAIAIILFLYYALKGFGRKRPATTFAYRSCQPRPVYYDPLPPPPYHPQETNNDGDVKELSAKLPECPLYSSNNDPSKSSLAVEEAEAKCPLPPPITIGATVAVPIQYPGLFLNTASLVSEDNSAVGFGYLAADDAVSWWAVQQITEKAGVKNSDLCNPCIQSFESPARNAVIGTGYGQAIQRNSPTGPYTLYGPLQGPVNVKCAAVPSFPYTYHINTTCGDFICPSVGIFPGNGTAASTTASSATFTVQFGASTGNFLVGSGNIDGTAVTCRSAAIVVGSSSGPDGGKGLTSLTTTWTSSSFSSSSPNALTSEKLVDGTSTSSKVSTSPQVSKKATGNNTVLVDVSTVRFFSLQNGILVEECDSPVVLSNFRQGRLTVSMPNSTFDRYVVFTVNQPHNALAVIDFDDHSTSVVLPNTPLLLDGLDNIQQVRYWAQWDILGVLFLHKQSPLDPSASFLFQYYRIIPGGHGLLPSLKAVGPVLNVGESLWDGRLALTSNLSSEVNCETGNINVAIVYSNIRLDGSGKVPFVPVSITALPPPPPPSSNNK